MSADDRLTDAAYVAVGAAVLVFQRAQVQRRELERWLSGVSRQLAEMRATSPDEPQAASPKG